MISLVVLFSAMVLAAGEPSVSAIIGYAAPAVALAPAAVSQQSRIEVKSTPAIVKTDVVAPALAPAAVAAPIAYSAPVAVAPAALSSQSEINIKSSPGLISTIAAAPLDYAAPLGYTAQLGFTAPLGLTATLGYTGPLAYGAPLALGAPKALGASIYTPAITSALIKTGPITSEGESVSAAPLEAALPVAPTETPEVAAARAAHLEAKAREEAHQIQKRSVGIVATSPVVSPVLTTYASSPVIYSQPITKIAPAGYPTWPYLTGAYGIHSYF